MLVSLPLFVTRWTQLTAAANWLPHDDVQNITCLELGAGDVQDQDLIKISNTSDVVENLACLWCFTAFFSCLSISG